MGLGRWLKHAYAISLVLLLHINSSLSLVHNHYANVTARCVERERDALLAIKGDLVDDYNLLSSWGGEDCCGWDRVHCDHQTGHVIQLHLNGLDEVNSSQGEYIWKSFQGEISPKIIELQYLEYLDLSYNYFWQIEISAFICSLSSLRHLDLHTIFPIIDGSKISIGNLTNLRYLDLSGNFLGDEFPYIQLGNLTHLQYLNLRNQINFNTNTDLSWLPHLSSLKYLDLGETNLSKASHWLETINKLPNLRKLSLVGCDLPPPNFSTLSHINPSNSLVSVDLSRNSITSPSIFKWLCNYNTTLVHLDLSFNQLSGLIPDVFANMSSLAYLDLSDNPLLEQEIPTSVAQLCNLQYLYLSGCNLFGKLSDTIQRWSACPQNPFESLDLSYNNLSGSFPNLTSFTSLEILNLSGNKLSGMIPESIGELSPLYDMDLSGNLLSGRIPESIGLLSLLKSLHLQENLLSEIPEQLGQMSSLQTLDISRNRLRGSIPQSIGRLSNLVSINLSMNNLEGEISETHLSKLFLIDSIDLSQNSFFNFNVSSDWTPPFQLSYLSLRSCEVGPNFPKWLRTQKTLSYLDMSNARISEVFPSWLWGVFVDFSMIDLSNNQIRGILESSEAPIFDEVRLSSNQLEGSVPSFLSYASYLDLSHNKFSEMTSFLCSASQRASYLDLSENHISKDVPDCLRRWVNLELLDLSNNSFSGIIPPGIGFLRRIKTLKLRSNKLVGEVPSSLKNCTKLNVIDLGNNHLSSSVPDWLGVSLPNLVILMLQFNKLSGSLPSQLCHLSQLQILDVSVNQISGSIPKCLNNLTSLAQDSNSNLTIRHPLNFDPSIVDSINRSIAEAPTLVYAEPPLSYYEDDATFMWKGTLASYKSTLGLVKRVDLSSNRLTGEIPSEITHLVGLVALNLSRNKLTGQIPLEIGKLKSLDSLDLSRNKIGGGIPTSLAHIDRLGVMDLSYNNLSGEIPIGTQLQGFDASCFSGNPWLCGLPLHVCDPEGTGPPSGSSDQEDRDEIITQGFYISLGLGFAVGFWGVCGSLIFKRSWRYAYYNFLNSLNDWLYVRVALIRRKLKKFLIRRS